MDELTKFKGVYCSGIFIPDPATVTALSLLFEKIRIPNDYAFIQEFSKKYHSNPKQYYNLVKIKFPEEDLVRFFKFSSPILLGPDRFSSSWDPHIDHSIYKKIAFR